MKFDLTNPGKVEMAKCALKELIIKGAYIDIVEVKKIRNNDQNRLYWLWINVIKTQRPEFTDRWEIHYLLRCLFLPKDSEHIESIIRESTLKIIRIHIDKFEYFRHLPEVVDILSFSTTELDKGQFSKYLKEIQIFARSRWDIILLNREDIGFEEFWREYGYY